MSMNPGASTSPSRSTTSAPAASSPGSATAAMRFPVTATSAARPGDPVPSTTRAPRSSRSNDGLAIVGTPFARPPGYPRFFTASSHLLPGFRTVKPDAEDMTIKKMLLAGSLVGVSLVAGVVAGLPSGALTSGSSTSPTTAPAASVAAPSSASASTSGCDTNRDDAWPDVANGVPAGFDAGDTGGVYLWHGPDGWHLRVTHRGDDGRV